MHGSVTGISERRREAIAENNPKNFFPKYLPDESRKRAKGPSPQGLAFPRD